MTSLVDNMGTYISNPPTPHLRLCLRSLVIIIFFLMFCSCSSLQAGLYLASIDNLDGTTILKNELEVKKYLEDILNEPEHYTIKAYERTGVSYQIRRTKLIVHSFYVIFEGENNFRTLSFYGTATGFYSEGAWMIDGDSDRGSYIMYTEGENKWDVVETKTNTTINTVETVKNILNKIESNVTYYYKDHIDNRPNVDNCNTALYETLVEER